jgi:hypothetical protein
MSGVNDVDVGASMQRLVWLATMTRPNEDPSKPFTPQCSSWQPIIVSRYTSFQGTIGAAFQDLVFYEVPKNSAWIITHVGIATQALADTDPGLGEAPFNYGDFRSETSLNPYGNFGTIASPFNPALQWVDQSAGAITPIVPSFAMQAQQVLIPIQAGTTGTLKGSFAFTGNSNKVRVFTTIWGWLVPPQVANRLQDFKTQWFVNAPVFLAS